MLGGGHRHVRLEAFATDEAGVRSIPIRVRSHRSVPIGSVPTPLERLGGEAPPISRLGDSRHAKSQTEALQDMKKNYISTESHRDPRTTRGSYVSSHRPLPRCRPMRERLRPIAANHTHWPSGELGSCAVDDFDERRSLVVRPVFSGAMGGKFDPCEEDLPRGGWRIY